jgi:hypothetical protein
VAKRQRKDNLHTSVTMDTPAIQTFVYRDVRDAVRGHWKSLPHRIVRKTKKYVYVEQYPFSPDDLTGSWMDQEAPTFRLERKELEQQGYAFIPVTAYIADTEEPIFYTRSRFVRVMEYKHELPRCFEKLNLTWPCTVKDVKKAYRTLVKHAHPDGEGTHQAFLDLQEAYEQALILCGEVF